jgi:hypothetical protein
MTANRVRQGRPLFSLPRERLCRSTVHSSRTSPRTVLSDSEFKYLAVRPELVEGLRAGCGTVSDGGDVRGGLCIAVWGFEWH